MSSFEISLDPERIDLARTSELIRQSYWGEGRSDAFNRRAFAQSICLSAIVEGQQVGFARASGDRTMFARISDVIVWPEHRGEGIGKALVEALLGHTELASVSIWTLNTSDAQALYARYGFRPVTDGSEMRLDRLTAA